MADMFSVRLNDELGFNAKDIDERAAQLGLTRSAFIVKSIEMMMGFDPILINNVEKYSQSLKIPGWLFMQNTLIKWFAEDAARYETGQKARVLQEFMFTAEGPITGEELFASLKGAEISRIQREIKNRQDTRDMIQNGVTLNGDEAWLDEEEKEDE